MLSSTTIITRGTTVNFTTTFYDVSKNVVQPASATINIVYPAPGGTATATVAMTGPTAPAVTWTAQWDSRGSNVGAVSWSIHSDSGPPFGVEDGEFILRGNPANLATFAREGAMVNLNRVVANVISAVNPRIWAQVQVSTGNETNADGTVTPSYASPVSVLVQSQPLAGPDLRQVESLNLQGTKKVFYLNGHIDGLIRPVNQGGDIITLADGSVWLVSLVLEGWDTTAGWCRVAAVLQNDAPAYGQS